MDIIKIPRQNDFTLAFPFVERKFVNGTPIDTPLDLAQYTDIKITVESQDQQYKADYEGTKDGNTLYVNFEEKLPINTYNVIISGKYNGKDKTSLLKRCFAIVQWNQQSNWTDYIAGSPILMPTSIFVASSNTSGMKTLVINVPLEDLAKIINSSTTNGFPDEYLVNADLGFGMNEINAFIEGKLNVQLMTNFKGVLSEEDSILTMMLDNAWVLKIPEKENVLLNGERILYTIGLSWINDSVGTFNHFICEFALSEHYCTAILEDPKNNTPDYSNAIAQAQQTADEAKQTAEEALEATKVADPTNGSYPTPISDALNNVHNEAFNAQTSADSAYQRADEAYNYAMGIVVPPDNSYEVQQAQSRADEAYTRAEEAFSAASSAQSTADEALGATQVTDPINGSYPTSISDALSNVYNATKVTDPTTSLSDVAIDDALTNVYNNLNNRIDGIILDDSSGLIIMALIVRDFTAYISLIGDGKCISISSDRYGNNPGINDALFNDLYLLMKSGNNNDIGIPFINYIYENTSRKVTLKFGGETLPTFKMTNVAYPDYNLDIIIDDIHVRQMIESQLGVSNVVALRMLEEPLTVGDNNDSCYWALVAEDGTVHNPGTY